jgi:hypothetical protein
MLEFELNHWIYSSVPDDLQPTTTPEERIKIFEFFKAAKNTDWYFTAKELSRAYNYESNYNSVKVRKIITELIELQGAPIISNNKGYRLAKNKDELIKYHESLQKRLKGLQRRVWCVAHIIALMPEVKQ